MMIASIKFLAEAFTVLIFLPAVALFIYTLLPSKKDEKSSHEADQTKLRKDQ